MESRKVGQQGSPGRGLTCHLGQGLRVCLGSAAIEVLQLLRKVYYPAHVSG